MSSKLHKYKYLKMSTVLSVLSFLNSKYRIKIKYNWL